MNKAEIKVSTLKEALTLTNKVLPNKPTLDILGYLSFDLFKITNSEVSTLHIKGTNLEETIIYKVGLENLENDFSFLLENPHKLLSFINLHNNEDIIKFELKLNENEDSGIILLKINKDKLKLPVSLDFKSYVKDIEIEDPSKINIKSAYKFREDLFKAKQFVANDPLRPVMNTVHLDNNNMVATNSHYLIRKNINYIEGDNFQVNFNTSFINSFPILKKDQEIEMFYNNKFIHIDFGYIELFSRLVDYKYPAYDSVIPKEHKMSLKVSLDDMKNTIKKSLLFSNEASGLIKLSIDKINVEILSEDLDFNKSFDGLIQHNGVENLNYLTDNDVFNIGVKGEFISKVLDNVIKKDEIELLFNSDSQAVVINDGEELYLIMPMMLN